MNLSKILIELLWKRKLGIEEYAHEKEFIRIYNKIKNKSKIHITIGENFNLYWLLKIRTKSIKGSVAEIGVHHGSSALMLAECKNQIDKLFLFDTWDIINDYKNETNHNPKDYIVPIKFIKQLFRGYDNVKICQGFFPNDTSHFVKNEKFKLVHIDANLKKSIRDSLNFFYPRLVKDGCIILHDYKVKRGIKTGSYEEVNNFCKKNKIRPIKMKGNHILILKC